MKTPLPLLSHDEDLSADLEGAEEERNEKEEKGAQGVGGGVKLEEERGLALGFLPCSTTHGNCSTVHFLYCPMTPLAPHTSGPNSHGPFCTNMK